jgi:5-methyltetrahydrofolate--homocysteine methyltransferase
MMGISPTQAGQELTELGADVIGINCGKSLDDNLAALYELRHATQQPIWFKPNAGLPKIDSQGNTMYDLTPEEIGEKVSLWLEAGAQVIGGCCGTSPEHLRQIANRAHAWSLPGG